MTEKETLINDIMTAPDSKKMAIISQNLNSFTAKELEELSIRIIADLQTSLEQHEKRSIETLRKAQDRQKHSDAGFIQPRSTYDFDTEAETAQKEAAFNAVSEAMSMAGANKGSTDQELNGPSSHNNAGSIETGYNHNVMASDNNEAVSDPSTIQHGEQVSSFRRIFTKKSRASMEVRGKQSNEVMPALNTAPKAIDSFHKVALWASVALAINVMGVLGVTMLIGNTFGQLVPFVLWMAFAYAGLRHREAIGSLVVTLGVFAYQGWPLIESGMASVAQLGSGSIPYNHSLFFMLAIVIATLVTSLWMFPLPKRRVNDHLKYRV